ncbi:GGDEF domain-containing protein [Cytobacillus pseudoceanisediminis]|uniref:GGDEF domain-containing protein n=1 Tax=Cytobacillus pseudoceanisediminis TaxID=3051614 RepID=A0ABZ2ZHQ3_9BACI|nr:GGDEF domain-containing protein [Cytobacillus oceanisediminis]EFV78696.1 hypothetical protein HMPREF1013_01072 [Bacillus sp. 2_A_57_CT2]QOK25493.1 GGDEF domain-containing protein [Cytobacillus oceanisediminis]
MHYGHLPEGKFVWLSEYSETEIMTCLLSILDFYNVFFIDSNGAYLKYSQIFKNFTQSRGFHISNQGHIADVFIELKDQKLFQSILSNVEINGIWSGKLMFIRGSSSYFSEAQVRIMCVNGFQHQNPIYMLLFYRDDEARSAEEEKWKELAYTDELTGLSNWRKFREKLSAIKKERESFGLLFIDIDNFKEINDRHGHIVGDKFLKLFANRIRESLGEKMYAFRKSGDEFLVIVEEGEQTEQAAKIIKRRLSDDFIIGKSVRGVSVSIGLSIYPSCGIDEESLIHHADKEMYKEKMRQSN